MDDADRSSHDENRDADDGTPAKVKQFGGRRPAGALTARINGCRFQPETPWIGQIIEQQPLNQLETRLNGFGAGHFKLKLSNFWDKNGHFKLKMKRFKLEMLRFKFEMRHFKFEMFHFNLEMKHFKLEMHHFKLEMKHFKFEMKRFKPGMEHFKFDLSHFKAEMSRQQTRETGL